MSKPGLSGYTAGIGAVASAAFASMCCILPVGLGAVGLSGAVLSGFFEPLRPYFLILSALLLTVGFYFAFRKPAEGEACSAGTSRLSRASRPTLFVAAFATAVFAVLPGIAGFASGGAEELAPEVASNVVVLEVDGMTCKSCAPAVRDELLDVPGVIDAAVSYERKVAEVRVREERAPSPKLLIEAVKKAGYSAHVEGQ
jgi:copper chaperone CopZ